ncbi:MAG: adenosylcobalamin-dependent ribonucleoside-diphosphate reductase, partial [Candidatus Moraniibacteriota bacterium]
MKITKLNKNAAAIMVNRYSLRDESGHPVESPAEILMRTARVVAEAENNYRSSGETSMEIREKFFEMLYEMRFVPNGRTMANAGTKYGQLANCFVLPVEDDLGKGTDSIFSVLRKAILTLQTGGGVGFSFGRIRPKDASISTTKGKATGAVSFIKVYDTAFWVIGQGGGRRSAAMAVLPVWHPDIYEFVRCKATEGQITNFNISVGLTDEFMAAVEKDEDFTLRHPENGEMYRMVPARELFAEIVKYAHKNGEPGVLFLDAANRSNPVPHLYKLEATNPCGEQFLGPYENCCLGSINLREHVRKEKGTRSKGQVGYEVDWNKLAETVELSVRFLDNVVDANKYVSAVPELEEAAHKVRRIGLSVMGLSDMMYMTGVRYGSEKGQELASQIMEFIRYHSMVASMELAQVR